MKTGTRSASGRSKAREILARRENALTVLFTALEKRDDVDLLVGQALAALEDDGAGKREIAAQSGLSTKEISTLIARARENEETAVNNDDADQDDDNNDSTEQTPATDQAEHNHADSSYN